MNSCAHHTPNRDVLSHSKLKATRPGALVDPRAVNQAHPPPSSAGGVVCAAVRATTQPGRPADT